MSAQFNGDAPQAPSRIIREAPRLPEGCPESRFTGLPEPGTDSAALLADLVASAIEMQPRFKAEPLFARTGTGYLKPAGVSEMAEARRADSK